MRTVLVIEDEANIRQFVAVNLKARGYNVVQAATAQDGLQKLREYSPEALLLDIKLPDMSGWNILSIIDNDATLQKIPVIVMTASSIISQPDEYVYANLVQKLIKPISAADLTQAVNDLFT